MTDSQSPATAGQESRSRFRYRQIGRAFGTGLASKAIAAASLATTMRLVYRQVGPERYGVWAMIASFGSLLSFSDFGVGAGLTTLIARLRAQDNAPGIARLTGGAVLITTAAGTILFACVGGIASYAGWPTLLGVKDLGLYGEATAAGWIALTCLCLMVPLGLPQRVELGYQNGHRANLWSAGARLAALAGVIVAVQARGGLAALVLASFALPALASVAHSLVLCSSSAPVPSPRAVLPGRAEILILMRLGGSFFVLQVAGSVAVASDSLVVAHVASVAAVGLYATVAMLFGVVTQLANIALLPFWPAYGDAQASGDVEWIKRALTRSITLAVGGSCVLCFALVMLGPLVIHRWMGRSLVVPNALLWGFSFWTTLAVGGNALAMFMNGTGAVALQARAAIAFALVSLPASILLGKSCGVAGVVWGTGAAYAACAVLPFAVCIRALLADSCAQSRSAIGGLV